MPPNRVAKLPKGSGVFKTLRAKSERAKTLLPQFAAEYKHGIVAGRSRLGKRDVRQEEGSGLLHVGGSGARICERRFALRVLLQRDVHRLPQRQRRRLLRLLGEQEPGAEECDEKGKRQTRNETWNAGEPDNTVRRTANIIHVIISVNS